MATAVVMPKLGNSVESSIIVRWKKQVGDSVAAGEALCEIETDKATVDVESPASGTVLAHFFNEGDDVPVMETIAAIGQMGEDFVGLRPEPSPPAPLPQGEGSKRHPTEMRGVIKTLSSKPLTEKRNEAAILNENGQIGSGIISGISPRARNLAARKGLQIDGLVGSGPGGRIIERDVQAALEHQPKLTPLAKSMVAAGDYTAPSQGTGTKGRVTTRDLIPTRSETMADEVQIIPMKGVRKLIAARMLQSMQTTAQLTMHTSADARALQAYRARLKNSSEAMGLRGVTINDLVLFAVARTLMQFPDLNALLKDDVIYQYKNAHLGFAVDTARGLVVPVVRNANQLTLKQLADETARLGTAVREGRVSPDELEGGTFTVTNLGGLGIEGFTPILNPPQVAILGVGNIHLKAVEVDGEVQFIPHIGLSLTVDHQAVDGAPGARFLKALVGNLAAFDMLLAV